MAQRGISPKSSLRKSLRNAYRARGKKNNNLWLVYSVKTDSDWLIPSDRQLVHWLYCLEANPEVATFDLAPEPILSHDDKESRATELDAIVTNIDGSLEWHEVKAEVDPDNSPHSQFLAQSSAASRVGVKYIIYTDEQLQSCTRIALRWLKALGFASALRGQEHNACRTAVITYAKDHGSGNTNSLLNGISAHDPPIVLGMLVRLAIQGVIRLNLNKSTFGLLTEWTYHG